MDKRKVCMLFLDIKEGFDNVNPPTLSGMLSAKGVNPYLVSGTWLSLAANPVIFFVGDLPKSSPQFQWAPHKGPQSADFYSSFMSPVYWENPYGLRLPYLHNFAMTASSDTYRHNVQLLQGQYAILKTKGSCVGAGFSIPKTELIHWRTKRYRD